MSLRPLGDTVIIEADEELIPVDTSQKVLDAVNSGLLVLPEKNMLMKLSNTGTVVSWGSKCTAPFKIGCKIFYDQFTDTPYWYYCDGKKYRIIKEHYVRAIIDD